MYHAFYQGIKYEYTLETETGNFLNTTISAPWMTDSHLANSTVFYSRPNEQRQ